jgi:hypothetical protein
VRTTGVATFGALGTEDRFVTSSIPVAGSEEAGKEPRFVLTAIPSRFNLDLRTPTGVGAMRAFIEGDFAGDGRAFRLRHAYGQWKGLLIGQTWSTFADPEAEPDGIDFEGLNAIALFRQPLVRFTKPLGARYSLAAAVENPAPDITNARGVSQVPDIVVRVSAYAGSGIGRYVTDLGTLGGQDAYFDPGTNTIDALPVFAWYLGYERRWDARLRSTFTYGTVIVDNIEAQPGDAFHMTNRWSLNLTWSPIPRVDLVGEFLFGNRSNKDGQKGASSQFQLGTNFRF